MINLQNLQQNVPLKNHTTFRIGGAAKYFFVASRQADFKKAVAAAKEAKLPFWFLGGGSNTLVSDGGFEGLVIKTDNKETKTEKEGETLKVVCEAGASFNRIILDSVKAGYSGVEWGFGIPGAIGGAVFGNAGRLGEDTPAQIWLLGDARILNTSKTAIFCSSRCPGNAILNAFDAARELRDKYMKIISLAPEVI